MKNKFMLKIIRKYIITTAFCLFVCSLIAGILWTSSTTGAVVLGEEPKSVTFSFDEQVSEQIRSTNPNLFSEIERINTTYKITENGKLLILSPIKNLMWFINAGKDLFVSTVKFR